jgi:hypothetical protein
MKGGLRSYMAKILIAFYNCMKNQEDSRKTLKEDYGVSENQIFYVPFFFRNICG